MTSNPKILLTGATGFIGGTLLTSTYGNRVRPTIYAGIYAGIDELETTSAVAAEHDIVINATLGFNSASTKVLIRGLVQRKANTGRDTITNPVGLREFEDLADDVYAHEKALEAAGPYAQRTTELGVIDTGLELGVKTVVIMSPIIYGNGTSLFNRLSIHTGYMKVMQKIGHVVVVGDGAGLWDHVHIEDLADLYRLVVLDIVEREGKVLPTGKKEIMFSGNGRHSWLEYSQLVADACYERGLMSERQVTHINMDEAAEILMPRLGFAKEELKSAAEIFCCNERTIANVARTLSWNPTTGDDIWERAFRDDVDAIASKWSLPEYLNHYIRYGSNNIDFLPDTM